MNLNTEYCELSELRSVPLQNKPLAIMFTGFFVQDNLLCQGITIISNFHDFRSGNGAVCQVRNEFQIGQKLCFVEPSANRAFCEFVGNTDGVMNADYEELREFVRREKRSQAVVAKACSVFNRIADRPLSRNTIGKQLNFVVVPANPCAEMIGGYYVSAVQQRSYPPGQLFLHKNSQVAVIQMSIGPADPNAPPPEVPVVPGNYPCPCGSGKRYKDCHSKNNMIKGRTD